MHFFCLTIYEGAAKTGKANEYEYTFNKIETQLLKNKK